MAIITGNGTASRTIGFNKNPQVKYDWGISDKVDLSTNKVKAQSKLIPGVTKFLAQKEDLGITAGYFTLGKNAPKGSSVSKLIAKALKDGKYTTKMEAVQSLIKDGFLNEPSKKISLDEKMESPASERKRSANRAAINKHLFTMVA